MPDSLKSALAQAFDTVSHQPAAQRSNAILSDAHFSQLTAKMWGLARRGEGGHYGCGSARRWVENLALAIFAKAKALATEILRVLKHYVHGSLVNFYFAGRLGDMRIRFHWQDGYGKRKFPFLLGFSQGQSSCFGFLACIDPRQTVVRQTARNLQSVVDSIQ